MPEYRFLGLTTRIYPGVRGADGRSLIAEPGQVYELDEPLDDGYWSLVGIPPETPPAGPEPAAEPVAPEPAPEPQAPAEAVSVPVTEPPVVGPQPFYFPGI